MNDIRKQFPILDRKVNGKDLIYFDNAATTQKPKAVLDAMSDFYTGYNANIHRGIHTLSTEATEAWEDAHRVVADFIGTQSYEEVVFTSGTTESLNLIVNIVGRELGKDDVVVISDMEHHSNIVPWQILQKIKGFKIEWVPVADDYTLDFDWYKEVVAKYGERIKVVSLVHISNVLGSVNDVKPFFDLAKRYGATTILDAAQSIAHIKMDVKALDVDFMVFSGHKMYGPTGIGAAYGKRELWEMYDPWVGGGDMIKRVTKEGVVWNDLPWKFEAGTPNIVGGIGLAASIMWVNDNVTNKSLGSTGRSLSVALIDSLQQLEDIRIVGSSGVVHGRSLVSFVMDDIHPHDAISLYNENGIAVRGGYHCAEPLHKSMGCGATVRASFGVYNTVEEIGEFVSITKQMMEVFK